MPPPVETKKIVIVVDTKGAQAIREVADQLNGFNRATKSLASTLDILKVAASSLLAGLSVGQLIAYSDEIQNLNNRYLALTGSQAEATQTLTSLQHIAQETNSSLAGTSDLYAKMALALGQAHLSGTSLQEIMKTLVNSFRLSGSSADEAYSAVNSLALAFELGGLKGRELRTVLRQNQVLALALRKEFGGELFSAANNGFITVAKFMEVVYKNMGNINARAALMSATFSQTMTKALDGFKIKLFEVNEALGAASGFSGVMKTATANMGTLVTVGTIIAASTLPAIIIQVGVLAASLAALAPAALALSGGLAVGLGAAVAAFGNSTDIGDIINQMQVGFSRLEGILDNVIAKFYELVVSFKSVVGDSAEGFDTLAAAARQAAKDHYAHAKALEIEYDNTKILSGLQKDAADAARRHAEDLAKLNKAFVPDLTAKQLLARLNAEFRSGRIDIAEYNKQIQDVKIEQLAKEFRDGGIDLEKLNEGTRKLQIYDLTTKVNAGRITFDKFDESIRNVGLDKLNEDLAAGRISIEEYNKQLAGLTNNFSSSGAFRTGLQDYVSSIGTSTQQVADLIKNTFSNLEGAIVEFTKKGQFDFAKFTQAILDDLLKIIIRMAIIKPIAGGILGAISPTGSTGSDYGSAGGAIGDGTIAAAHGAVFDRGLAKFAQGGVIGSPTLFKYGSGSTGLMGEAGPEAIIPLRRGSGGDLGVKASLTPVTININNNAQAEVKSTETTGPGGERVIEVLITNKVRDGLASGSFDKIMQSSYGLKRKGS